MSAYLPMQMLSGPLVGQGAGGSGGHRWQEPAGMCYVGHTFLGAFEFIRRVMIGGAILCLISGMTRDGFRTSE